jgi:transketolase
MKKNKKGIAETAKVIAAGALIAAGVAEGAPTNAELVQTAKGYAVECSGIEKLGERKQAVTQEVLSKLDARGGKVNQGTIYEIERKASAVGCLTDKIKNDPNFVNKTVSFKGMATNDDISGFEFSINDAGQATIKAPEGSELRRRVEAPLTTDAYTEGYDERAAGYKAEYDKNVAQYKAEYDKNVAQYKAEHNAKVEQWRADQANKIEEFKSAQAEKKARFLKEQEVKKANFRARNHRHYGK